MTSSHMAHTRTFQSPIPHDALLEKIRVARGRELEEIWAGQGGLVDRVIAGAMNARGHVAWIQEIAPGYANHVEGFHLHVAASGQTLIHHVLGGVDHVYRFELESFECFEERVTVGYRAEHGSLLLDAPFLDPCARIARLGFEYVYAHDRVLSEGRSPGLFEARSLDGLRPLLPIPIGALDADRFPVIAFHEGTLVYGSEASPERVGLPPRSLGLCDARIADVIADHLVPRRDAETDEALSLIIASLAFPFFVAPSEPMVIERDEQTIPPYADDDESHLLPAYVYKRRRAHDPAFATTLLALIDDLAARARPPEEHVDWSDPDRAIARVAAEHVARQSVPLAQLCRSGEALSQPPSVSPHLARWAGTVG